MPCQWQHFERTTLRSTCQNVHCSFLSRDGEEGCEIYEVNDPPSTQSQSFRRLSKAQAIYRAAITMAELNTSLVFAQQNGNAPGQVRRELNHWGLEMHKDEILALYNSPGTRMKDLPQLAEVALGIKARCVPPNMFSLAET